VICALVGMHRVHRSLYFLISMAVARGVHAGVQRYTMTPAETPTTEALQTLHMSGARAAEASEALGLTSMMAWLGRVPRRAAGGRGMCRDVCSFRIL
jgi:hypothetical protein